jgi:hypothetical protein
MEFKSFGQYITEASKEVTIAWGRFNPPTIGHEKLLEATSKVASGGTYRIYASQSTDAKKNPLDYASKIKYMRKMFPRHARSIILDKDMRTIFDILNKLYSEGFTKVNLVAGSDRVPEFEALTNKYNGVKGRHGFYNFEGGVNVISAGERDPDADGATGMSASKLRQFAVDNDFQNFVKGLPAGFKEAKNLFNDIRKGMGLKESHDFRSHIQLESVSDMREAYITGALFSVGDIVVVKESDELGEVIMLGSNYVLVEMSDGKKVRKWLESVEKLDEVGEVKTADYKINPETGQKVRAKTIKFKHQDAPRTDDDETVRNQRNKKLEKEKEKKDNEIASEQEKADKQESFTSFSSYIKRGTSTLAMSEDAGTVKHHQFQKTFNHAMQHAKIHKDVDADGDVDATDKMRPDEVVGAQPFDKGVTTKKLQKSLDKEIKQAKKHIAFEQYRINQGK